MNEDAHQEEENKFPDAGRDEEIKAKRDAELQAEREEHARQRVGDTSGGE